jgi:hypothetical protein
MRMQAYKYEFFYMEKYDELYNLYSSRCIIRRMKPVTTKWAGHVAQYLKQDVAAEWLAFLHRILEVPGSNLGLAIGYLTEVSCGLPQPHQTNDGILP